MPSPESAPLRVAMAGTNAEIAVELAAQTKPLLFSDATNRWRARAEVWPPERSHETSPGILLRFSESASGQKAVVQAALEAARQYIDASQSQHQ